VSFLERFLDFKPGEPYSYAKTYQTQLNLINSDRFSSVTVREEKERAEDLRVPVRIHLKDSPPHRLRPGVGYATDTGARLSLRYQDLNVFRGGHELNTDLTVGERLSGLFVSYAIPRAGHVDNRTIFKTALQQEIVNPYDSKSFTLEGEHARSFGAGIVGSAYLQFLYETFSEPDRDGKSTLLIPGLRFSQRRVDDIVRPRKGFRYSLETRGSTDFLGAETNFAQFLGNADGMIPLPYKFTLLPRAQVGATWQRDALTDLPPTLRFYAGGDRSVRGYTYQSLGPKDSNGNVIGGKNLLVGSLELEYALTREWALAAFYDAGNAFNNLPELHWAQGAGLGIRYYTIAGPIRVDVARQINVLHPGYQLHISVGFVL
jgi:translocation and assembly module TamA